MSTAREIILFPLTATKEERLEVFEAVKEKHSDIDWQYPNSVAEGSVERAQDYYVIIRVDGPYWKYRAAIHPVGTPVQDGIITTHMDDWLNTYSSEVEL